MNLRSITLTLLGVWLLTACTTPAAAPNVEPSPLPPTTATATVPESPKPVIGTAEPSTSQKLPEITPSGVPPQLPVTINASTQTGAPPVLTMSDSGSRLILRPGQLFLLALDEGYNWHVQISNPQIVSPAPSADSVQGNQLVFEALQPGSTDLTASGDPPCLSETPACMMPSLLFTLIIVVK